MTVKELIQILKQFNPEKELLISQDEEGNLIYTSAYVQEFPKEIVLYPSGDSKELPGVSEEEWQTFYKTTIK